MEYDQLLMLKRIPKEVHDFYSYLNSRKSEKSKNILIICRSIKDARESLRGMARNYLGEEKCKAKMSSLILEVGESKIIFMPINRKDMLYGRKYKEYYFDDEYNIMI